MVILSIEMKEAKSLLQYLFHGQCRRTDEDRRRSFQTTIVLIILFPKAGRQIANKHE